MVGEVLENSSTSPRGDEWNGDLESGDSRGLPILDVHSLCLSRCRRFLTFWEALVGGPSVFGSSCWM